MKKLTNFFVYIIDFLTLSNLFISVCAFFFTFQTSLFFKIDSSLIVSFGLTNALAVFFLYNLQRLYFAFGKGKILNQKDVWYIKHKFVISCIFVLVLFASSSFIIKVMHQLISHWLICVIPLFISLFYFLPPFKLREKHFLKPFLISFSWVFVCVYLPLCADAFKWSDSENKQLLIYLLSQFAFFSAICIPFDIRDIEIDKQRLVKSIPALIGINLAKIISILLLGVYCFFGFMLFGDGITSLGFLLTTAVASVFVIYSNPNKSSYYYSLLGDGLILFQFFAFQVLFY